MISDLADITDLFIRKHCKALFADMIPCAKQQVFAVLAIKIDEGFICFFGTNYSNSPIYECPGTRNEQGEKTYKNCKKICRQDFHAETHAIHLCKESGFDPKGGLMYITGHPQCCCNCENAIIENEVAYAKSFDSTYEKHFQKQNIKAWSLSSCFFWKKIAKRIFVACFIILFVLVNRENRYFSFIFLLFYI